LFLKDVASQLSLKAQKICRKRPNNWIT